MVVSLSPTPSFPSSLLPRMYMYCRNSIRWFIFVPHIFLFFFSPLHTCTIAWWLCLPPCPLLLPFFLSLSPFPSFSSPPYNCAPWLKEIIMPFLLLLPSVHPACNLQIGGVASFPGLLTLQIFFIAYSIQMDGGRSCLNNEWQGFGCENVWCMCRHCMKMFGACVDTAWKCLVLVSTLHENVWCLCRHCMKSLQDCLFSQELFSHSVDTHVVKAQMFPGLPPPILSNVKPGQWEGPGGGYWWGAFSVFVQSCVHCAWCMFHFRHW